jgi:hypothetical protein
MSFSYQIVRHPSEDLRDYDAMLRMTDIDKDVYD